jgi:hypothetical protein
MKELLFHLQDLQESGILDLVDQRGTDTSLARQRYAPDTETAINDSINVAYTLSYAFHSKFEICNGIAGLGS